MKKTPVLLLVLVTAALCVSCGDKPASGRDTPSPGAVTADESELIRISDYYDADGAFSELGLALAEENAEKVLAVNSGDTLVVGDRRYRFAVSRTIPFYTQPSLDEVMGWWMNYCENLIANGEISELN